MVSKEESEKNAFIFPPADFHCCQMAIARFLDCMCFALWALRTLAPLRYATKFDPFLSLDCARVEGEGIKFCHLATLRVCMSHVVHHFRSGDDNGWMERRSDWEAAKCNVRLHLTDIWTKFWENESSCKYIDCAKLPRNSSNNVNSSSVNILW